MKILDVLYYYYYLIYTKIIPDDEPNATTIFCLGFSFGWLLVLTIECLLSFVCLELGKILAVTIGALPITALYLLYWRTKRYRIIIRNRPFFFNSHNISKLIVGAFFVFVVSSMIWGPFLIKYIDEQIGCEQRVSIETVIVKWVEDIFT